MGSPRVLTKEATITKEDSKCMEDLTQEWVLVASSLVMIQGCLDQEAMISDVPTDGQTSPISMSRAAVLSVLAQSECSPL